MGVTASKSPLERRNTVLRRSQRKSIHGAKGKAEKLAKDIKKFKGTEEDSSYVDLKARIEALERDLKLTSKNLQPQIRGVYQEALKKAESCHQLLSDKLAENREKARAASVKSEDDEVFVEEVEEGKEEAEERKTVELKLIQVEPIEASPQLNKRLSVMKVGVPVMPDTIMEAIHRKTLDLEMGAEGKVAGIRKRIEEIELEISQFVGKKNGKYYSNIKEQLEGYDKELKTIFSTDEAIKEQVKLCSNYIGSCLSFLDEKAVENNSEDDEEEGPNKIPEGALNGTGIIPFSTKSLRTTYI